MERRAVVFLLLATGCRGLIGIEEAVPAPFSYTEAGTGGVVTGPGFALRFAGGDGFHFPDSLTIDGVEVIGRDPAQGCFREDEVGLLIAPAARFSAHGATPSKNLLTAALRGPAVVQVKLEWETVFSACDPTRGRGGTSTFTVFPDGRIVRRDSFEIGAGSLVAPVPCACEPPVDDPDRLFNISTYWTLDRTAFVDLHAPDPGELPRPGELFGNRPRACANGGAYQVAFAWRDAIKATIRGAAELIGFGLQLGLGLSALEAYREHHNAAVFVERSTCAKALQRAQEYLMPQALRIDGDARMPSDRDGIYGGETGDGDPPGVELASTRVELGGPAPPGFAVWLRFPRPVDELEATRAGATGSWYVPQRVDERSWIVWFRDALLIGETIVLEAI